MPCPAVFLCLLLAAAPVRAQVGAPGAGEGPPSFLLILADDLGPECLGSYGGVSYRTPHLDRLAREGLRFTRCYATPLCVPSRVQLLTGRYPFRTGFANNVVFERPGTPGLDPALPNLARVLQAAGYATAIAGKWHLGSLASRPDHARACGFQESLLFHARDRYRDSELRRNGKSVRVPADAYAPDLYVDFLVDFMAANRDRPFLAFYSAVLPHKPFTAPPGTEGGEELDDQACFRRMVERLDANVGRLLAALDEYGLRERTVVLFAGDNGTDVAIRSRLADGRTIRGGKGTLWERGVRVPLLVSWPGTVPPGGACTDLVDFTDFLPTLAELAGVPPERRAALEPLDGHSFAWRLLGRPGEPRKWVFSQLRDRSWIRDERWKLFRDGRFFDLQEDPGETRDLRSRVEDDPALRAARDRLARLLASLHPSLAR